MGIPLYRTPPYVDVDEQCRCKCRYLVILQNNTFEFSLIVGSKAVKAFLEDKVRVNALGFFGRTKH